MKPVVQYAIYSAYRNEYLTDRGYSPRAADARIFQLKSYAEEHIDTMGWENSTQAYPGHHYIVNIVD